MKTNTLLRASLLASAASACIVSATPAFAQEASESEDQIIIVTGSRIVQRNVESEAPLQILNAETIQSSGVTNVQELLLENPAFGVPGYSRTNTAFATSGTGVASIDLRDLGSDRTLVLVNGRRVVASIPGTATVDLNVIPTQFVERIDVLTGGASSLYGSDAVAGVVNFIYKRDFEGVDLQGQYGVSGRGDDSRYQLNATIGTKVADGRGHIMVHFGYSNESGLYSRQRKGTRVDDFSEVYFTGAESDIYKVVEPFLSSFPPQGRFITSGGTFTYGPGGGLQPCFTTNGTTCGNGAGAGPNGFNRQAFRTLAVPVERYLFAATGEYELTSGVNLFFEGTFNKTSSARDIEPFPLESGGSNGIFPTGGGYNIETAVTRNFGNGVETRLIRNPYVPLAIFNAATDTNGDGLRDIGFARRLSEFGNRLGSTERDFYRFVIGLQGDAFDNKFRWDVSYNYGQVNENQISSGQVNVVNFRDALAGIPDFDDINGNGLTTDVICANAEARANGCIAANIFGAGSISQGAVDYINAQGTFQTGIKQHIVQGNMSGTLFELPGGPAGIAVGFEYRKEESFEDHDALTNAGLNAGNKLPDTRGSFDVKEAFVEVNLPILANIPGVNLLEVGGAFRIADYSTVGSIESYSLRATYSPIPDVRVRGTWARAVRAPNVAELFSGLAQTFPPGLTDPCLGVGPSGGGVLGDSCRAAPGVAANIAANGVFTLNQADLQGISGFDGGNPNLGAETADSWTIGASFNPQSISALRNLVLTVDYYNIKIKDVISTFPRQFTLDKCFGDGNATFCDLITRRPTATAVNSSGSIEFVDALNVNAAIQTAKGIDATLSWNTPFSLLTPNDRLAVRFSYNHIFELDYTPLLGEPVDPAAGEIGTPKDRFTANLTYSNDFMRLGFTGTYFGKSYEDDQFCTSFDFAPKCGRVAPEFYLDMQTSFFASDALEVYFGIDNLLDNDAPLIPSGTTFNITGADTAADVYDVFGRRFYAGVRMRF